MRHFSNCSRRSSAWTSGASERSTATSTTSVLRMMPEIHPSEDSYPMGGRSTSWMYMSSKGSMPESGITVDIGYSATTGWAFVSTATRALLPALAKPMRAA